MAKPELGEKQVCPHCGAKFYDLGRRPASCPKCHTSFDPTEEVAKPRRVKARAPAGPVFQRDEEEPDEDEAEAEDDDVAADEEEDEVEDAPELDAAVDDPIETGEEDEEDAAAPDPDALPAGFSEDDPDLVEEDDLAETDEDDVLLEDDEFSEEIDDVEEAGGKDDEDV